MKTPTEVQDVALVTRVSQELADVIAKNAQLHERSISAELRLALRSWVESLQEKAA